MIQRTDVTGTLAGNETLAARGKVQKHLGKAQAKHGDLKHDVKDMAKPA